MFIIFQGDLKLRVLKDANTSLWTVVPQWILRAMRQKPSPSAGLMVKAWHELALSWVLWYTKLGPGACHHSIESSASAVSLSGKAGVHKPMPMVLMALKRLWWPR